MRADRGVGADIFQMFIHSRHSLRHDGKDPDCAPGTGTEEVDSVPVTPKEPFLPAMRNSPWARVRRTDATGYMLYPQMLS